jgi:hypothetical protein
MTISTPFWICLPFIVLEQSINQLIIFNYQRTYLQANLVLLANHDDAKQAYQAAQAELETAQESRNDVAEKPFDFYGSNLSTTEQTSWGKTFSRGVQKPHVSS